MCTRVHEQVETEVFWRQAGFNKNISKEYVCQSVFCENKGLEVAYLYFSVLSNAFKH